MFLAVVSLLDVHCTHHSLLILLEYLLLWPWALHIIAFWHSNQSCPRNWIWGLWWWIQWSKLLQMACCFNHNLVGRCIARNKHLLAKQGTQSSTVIVHDCPLSNINASAPKLHGYETYAIFHNTSMEQEVSASDQSMPMTLYFATLDFSCPDIVFLSLPRCPPDGLITSSLVLILISSIFTIITTCICIQLRLQQIKRIQVTQSALRELLHMVLREAPTRFYLILREHLHHVFTLFHSVSLVHNWLDLQQFHNCLWLKSKPLQYHHLTQIHLFGYATTQQLVTSAMTSLFSLENLFLQFISLVQQQALPNQC